MLDRCNTLQYKRLCRLRRMFHFNFIVGCYEFGYGAEVSNFQLIQTVFSGNARPVPANNMPNQSSCIHFTFRKKKTEVLFKYESHC